MTALWLTVQMSMSRITDFHSHILPGIDDGSKSIEESLRMLRMEAEQGIGHVVATPHFYPNHDNPERFLRRREQAEKQLREAMAFENSIPVLSVGAEVYFFKGISESEWVSQLTIDSSKCIMIEMIGAPWEESIYRELEALHTRRGLCPVIAHVERYIGGMGGMDVLNRLSQLPVLIQSNADFFLNWKTSRKALRMLKNDCIHLLGSDCHSTEGRKPNLGMALEVIQKKLGEQILERIEACQRIALEKA